MAPLLKLWNALCFSGTPVRLKALVRKAISRAWPGFSKRRGEAYQCWLTASGIDLDQLLSSSDPESWQEAREYADRLQASAAKRLESIEVTLGGAAHIALLYYLVLRLRPAAVVETGVAAGYSSQAILEALSKNGSGHLYSSDLPYIRLAQPDQYVGLLVADELRDRWTLLKDGDRANLPLLLAELDRVDLFSYDSDKSVQGRRFAMSLVEPLMHDESICVMDDINDNPFFQDYIALTGRVLGKTAAVLRYEGKYVGILGDLDRIMTRK